MKKMLLALVLVATPLSLTACASLPVAVGGPSSAANLTKADEQLAIGANLAYKTFRLAVETGVQSGLIKGERAGKLASLDNQLFELITAIDAAYRAANAASLADAVGRFNTVLAQANALIPTGGH